MPSTAPSGTPRAACTGATSTRPPAETSCGPLPGWTRSWGQRAASTRDPTCWTWAAATATRPSGWPKAYGCRVTGIDLSGVRVDNAKEMAAQQPEELQRLLRFEHGSATDLPFADGEFTHVWSQATIYHVPDKETALQESRRVLAQGGLLVLGRPAEAQTGRERAVASVRLRPPALRHAIQLHGLPGLPEADRLHHPGSRGTSPGSSGRATSTWAQRPVSMPAASSRRS